MTERHHATYDRDVSALVLTSCAIRADKLAGLRSQRGDVEAGTKDRQCRSGGVTTGIHGTISTGIAGTQGTTWMLSCCHAVMLSGIRPDSGRSSEIRTKSGQRDE